jgi:hypothetical protein
MCSHLYKFQHLSDDLMGPLCKIVAISASAIRHEMLKIFIQVCFFKIVRFG